MIYLMAFLKGIGNKLVIDSAFSNAEFGFNKMPLRMLRPYFVKRDGGFLNFIKHFLLYRKTISAKHQTFVDNVYFCENV